ncbi:diguanylate cyclase domain-containing protein [Actinoplanes sp. GCM10030250]|uniref:diguanylate cyclase domain-containing protein n=1 Tax=Actinoplanes sp. GCM10030250 TaxID=3273376 RepID=UPI00361A5E13
MSAVPVCVLALTAVLAFLFLSPGQVEPWQPIVCWLVVASFAAAMTYHAFRATRLMGRDDPERRFWVGFAFAGVIFTLGDAVQFLASLAAPLAAGSLTGTGIPRTIGLGLGSFTLVAVVMTYPLPHRSRRERLCYLLDMATVIAAAGAYGLYWTISSGWDVLAAGDVAGVVLGPVAAMLAAFVVGRLYLSGTAPFTWHIGVLGPVAAVAEGISRVLGPELARAGRPGPIFAMTVAAHGVLMILGWWQHRRYRAGAAARPPARTRPYSLMPYLAVAATYSLLIGTLIVHGLDVRAWVILAGAVGSTAIVVARQIVAFRDNAELLAERDVLAARLHTMAFTDSLTGLANRAMFLDELEAALREPGDIGVLLIDLDDFKPVNDRYGHAAGDTVLMETAIRLRAMTEEADVVARLGGDEFAVLVRQPPADGFTSAASRIVQALETPCRIAADVEVEVRASVGLAVSPAGPVEADTLLRTADEAMYRAKHGGKGALHIAG